MGDVLTGAFASEIEFLSGLSQALAGSKVAKLPKVELNMGRVDCRFYYWGTDRWDLPEEERREAKRLGIEAEIAAVVDLFPGAEWKKNDPTGDYGGSYYQLQAQWENVTITILTERKDVCERVVVLEHDVTEEVPDPEILKSVPLVKVTQKKQVVEWQCNTALAEKTAPLISSKKMVVAS